MTETIEGKIEVVAPSKIDGFYGVKINGNWYNSKDMLTSDKIKTAGRGDMIRLEVEGTKIASIINITPYKEDSPEDMLDKQSALFETCLERSLAVYKKMGKTNKMKFTNEDVRATAISFYMALRGR